MTPSSRSLSRRLRPTISAVALAAGLLFPGVAPAALSPGLDRELGSMGAEETVPVIVTLDEQAEPTASIDTREELLQEKQELAVRSQPAVARIGGDSVRRFWLVNSMALRATPAEVRRIAAHPAVASVALDRPVVTTAGQAPTPFASPGDVWGVASVYAPAVRNRYGLDGTGVLIGSIDTGVDAGHPELAGKVAAWRDFVSGRPTAYDDNGHGTHTIGTMVGGAVHGAPVGVAPGARVAVAKAMGADGMGNASAIMAAAQWLADPDGNPATADQPAVINNSWATSGKNDVWFRPMVRAWRALGIVPVFAAGNTGPTAGTISSPADYPESIAVGSVDRDGSVSSFSARGPVVWSNPDGLGPAAGTPLTKPDLVAPGGGVTSTVPGGYLTYSGTSMAAPHVAATVALMRQAAPGMSPDAVAQLLRATAADGGTPGPDDAYGAGALNTAAALGVLRPSAPDSAPSAGSGPPASAPSEATTRTRLERKRMLATRRVAVTAERRAAALEVRVFGRASGPRARTAARGGEAGGMLVTRRIARDALARAARIEARLAGRSAPVRPRSAAGSPVPVTAHQLRITERLAAIALTRVRALEGRVRAQGARG